MQKDDANLFSTVAKGLLFLAIVVFIVWFFFQTPWKNIRAEVTSQPYARTITVTGEGKITSKPDKAVVSLSVVAQGNTVKQVTQEGNQQMTQVVNAVKSLGVKDEDVKTINYNLYPDYRYPENQKPQIAGYRLEQTLEVAIRDLTKVEDVVDKGVSAGANQVGQLSFVIDKDSEVKKQARDEAFKAAKKKAEEMAQSAGVSLGRVVTFSESGDYNPPVPVYARMDMKAESAAGSIAPTIESGSQETTVNVSVTYEID